MLDEALRRRGLSVNPVQAAPRGFTLNTQPGPFGPPGVSVGQTALMADPPPNRPPVSRPALGLPAQRQIPISLGTASPAIGRGAGALLGRVAGPIGMMADASPTNVGEREQLADIERRRADYRGQAEADADMAGRQESPRRSTPQRLAPARRPEPRQQSRESLSADRLNDMSLNLARGRDAGAQTREEGVAAVRMRQKMGMANGGAVAAKAKPPKAAPSKAPRIAAKPKLPGMPSGPNPKKGIRTMETMGMPGFSKGGMAPKRGKAR